MEIGLVQVGEQHIMQRHRILRINCDHHVRSDLLGMAQHGRGIGKRRLAELERVRARRKPLTVFDPKFGGNTNMSAPAPALRISFGPPIRLVGAAPAVSV